MIKPWFKAMSEDDLEIVFKWRRSDHVQSRMFTEVGDDFEKHREWFTSFCAKKDRRFWIIMVDDIPIGAANYKEVEGENGRILEVGFYIGDSRYINLAGFVLPYFYHHVFENICCEKVVGEVLVGNPILNMHAFHGYDIGGAKAVDNRRGATISVVPVALSRENWRKRMKGKAYVTEFLDCVSPTF